VHVACRMAIKIALVSCKVLVIDRYNNSTSSGGTYVGRYLSIIIDHCSK